MARNLMGLYNDVAEAERLVNDLVGAGVPRARISVVCRDQGRPSPPSIGLSALPSDSSVLASGPLSNALTRGSSAFAGGARTHDVAQALTMSGVPAHEAQQYDKGLSMGHVLVAVNVRQHNPDRIIEIMQQHDPLDIERLDKPAAAGFGRSGTVLSERDKPAPVGGKPYRFDSDVDRADSSDRTRPQEPGSFAPERSNVPFAGRDEGSPRGPQAEQVRRDRLPPGEFARYEPRFRTHFNERLGGGDFERYRPAYEFGAALALSNGGLEWSQLERVARERWEESQPGHELSFDQARDCIRYGFDEGRPARV